MVNVSDYSCEVCLKYENKQVLAVRMCRGLEVCMDCFYEGGI